MEIKCKINGCDNPVGIGKKYCNRHINERENKIKAVVGVMGAAGVTAWTKRNTIIKFCKTSVPKVAKVGIELGTIAFKKFIK